MPGRFAAALSSLRVPGPRLRRAGSRVAAPVPRPAPVESRVSAEARAAAREDTGGTRRFSLPVLFIFFLALAIVQTWPLALHITDHAIAWPGDSYVMWWNMAWVKDSLFTLSNPFHTDALYHPRGTDLYLHTLAPVNSAITVPLQVASGGNLLLSWNLLMLTFLTLSGVGGYLLSYHVTRERWMSLVSGVIFAFSPHVMMQLHGHFHIATTWPIPFFALFLLRFFERRSKVDLILVAFLAALVTWNWLEFAIDLGLFAVLAFAFWAWRQSRGGKGEEVFRLAKDLLPGVALWALLSAPILVLTAVTIRSGGYTVTAGGDEAAGYAPDLVAYLIPSPLWGPGEYANNYGAWESTLAGGIETTMYLGFAPLMLAALAFAFRRRSALGTSALFWSIVFLFFALLALGPRLQAFTVDTHIPMPFRLLQEVPLVGERRVPGRMIVVGMLALGVLSAIGATVLAQLLRGSSRYAAPVVACAVLAVVLFEYWSPPVNLAGYETPPVYDAIAAESGDFAVLDLPLGRVTGNVRQGDAIGGALSDYAQIVHGKPTVGGYISRARADDLDWLAAQPGLGYLSCLDCAGYPRPTDLDGALVHDRLTDLRIRYVVVNLVTFEGEPTTIAEDGLTDGVRHYLGRTVGLTEAGSGDGWFAYRNQDID